MQPNLALVANTPSRLATLHAERAQLRSEASRLAGVAARLNEAQAAEHDALVAVGQLGSVEVAAMRDWASAGALGDPPSPDVKKRASLARKLAEASQMAVAAKGATADVEAEQRTINDRLAAADVEIDAAAGAEIADQARAEFVRIAPLAQAVAAGLARIVACRVALVQLGRERSDRGDVEGGRPFFALAEALAGEPAIDAMPTNGMVAEAIERQLATFASLVAGSPS